MAILLAVIRSISGILGGAWSHLYEIWYKIDGPQLRLMDGLHVRVVRQVGITLVWEVHDLCRLWNPPPGFIGLMDQMDLTVSLRSEADNLEVNHLLQKIEKLN